MSSISHSSRSSELGPGDSASATASKRSLPCDEVDFYSRKRPRKQADPVEKLGKHVGRAIDAFEPLFPTLEDGSTCDETAEMLEDLDPKKCRRVRFFNAIEAKYPRLVERLAEGEENGVEYIAKLIEKGRSEARTEDTNRLKSYIVEILQSIFERDKTVGLSMRSKTSRGWEHALTGRLLTPWNMDWDDPKHQEDLKCGTAGANVSAGAYPNFLFAHYKPNKDRLFIGFLQNDLMLCATLCIFVSPTASLAADPSRSRSNRAGNAQIAGMTEMTVPALAYVAFQLRFAMSSEEMFFKGGHDTFDYSRFYYNIIQVLEMPAMEKHKREILDWYNVRVFPSNNAAVASVGNETADIMVQQALAYDRGRGSA